MTADDREGAGSRAHYERGALLAASLRPGWAAAEAPMLLRDPVRRAALTDLWERHGLAPLIWHRLQGTGLESTVEDTLGEMAFTSKVADLVQTDTLGSVLEIFRARGVEPILVKGLAAARMYPEPSLRLGGDLDFWVRPRELAAARSALRDAAFMTTYDPGVPFPSENTFGHPSGLQIDLKGSFKGISPAMHRRWWRRAIRVEIGTTPVRVLAPPDDVVYLSNHAIRHAYCGAKWLMDIAMLLERWDEQQWGPLTLPRSQPARSWSLTTVGLALSLLDADRSALSPGLPDQARHAAAPWIGAVLEAWGGAQVESAAVTLPAAIQRLRAEPSAGAIGRLLRDLWPRPLEAAVYLQMPLRPRFAQPMRIAAFARRRLWAPLWHLRAHSLVLRGRLGA